MAESRRAPVAWAWLLLGAGLALAVAWPHPAGLLGAWLAQPALALGLASLRGLRPTPGFDGAGLREARGLALVWLMGLVLVVLATAWPLAALRDTGSLLSALALSGMAGAALLCLWRAWPAFGLAERESGRLPPLAAAVGAGGPAEAGRGFVVALAVFAVLAGSLLVAWPGLVPAPSRWLAAGGLLAAALAAHALVQRFGGPPAAPSLASLPIYGDDDEDAVAIPSAAEEGLSPEAELYAATRAGRIEAALSLLEAGVDPSAEPDPADRDQRTLPMLAALLGDLRLLRELIARGVDLNDEHAGLTPLLAATRDSWHGRPEAVMTLLANGADARRADAEGNTPLHHAARSTDAAVAALLLDAGATLEALNAEGFSPLGVACVAGNWRLARFLIERGAKPEPKDGQPALLAAVVGDDDTAGVQLLLRHKARVDARGTRQRTALLLACAAGNADIVGELLDAGADRNAHDADGITPLLEAARGNHAGVLARLALARPDVAAVDGHGRNALVLATEAGAPPELLRHLIALGVNPEQRDGDGRRALEHALGAGRWPLVAVLDPSYPLPASVAEGLSEGHFEKTPRELLREALQSGRRESAEAMQRLGAGPDAAGLASLLLEFSGEGDAASFDWLLGHGARADVVIDGELSVFFHLLGRGGHAMGALQRLLEVAHPVGGRGGLARWLQACLAGEHTTRGHEHFALALLERGADAFGGAPSDPPLGLAIQLGWLRLAEALLASGVDPNARDGRGHTALHVAATLGRESALRVLIRHGASPALAAPDGQTPLGLALAADRRELSHWLEWRQWQLPGRTLQAADLPAAAMAGDAEAVLRLLELGLPVDGTDTQGCTALLRAAGGGHDVVVALLLERGADTRRAARTGATPLSAAISMRHVGVVDQLLRAGAEPDLALPGEVTPLMLAAALGQPELVSRLLAHDADPQARDAQGLGPLHCAALHAFSSRDRQRVLALMDILLLADAAPDEASALGQTPLLLLLGARAEPGAACDEDVLLAALERLLAEDVSLDTQDQRGYTPLHLAAMHGLPRVVQRLLREGGNRQARDGLGRTPHDLAVLRGFVDVAAEFEPARTGTPSLARFLRDPR
ncbi:MAG TPA: ankyrin repeat domain-containing protein [Arenimonas sp.]|uniref:ankyrin repeat domain-containing protein n=1 Tax=Arenimonas sp. TaxID=1872635 RepID=UPI002D7E88CA|nr:ankyrin repeat domain-containing protein [Arenimonas sp.]HEU0153915.1 ankyrin repeat domain-containing protein [Arenimonas sp.]